MYKYIYMERKCEVRFKASFRRFYEEFMNTLYIGIVYKY